MGDGNDDEAGGQQKRARERMARAIVMTMRVEGNKEGIKCYELGGGCLSNEEE